VRRGHRHLARLLLERLVPTAILWPGVALILHMMLLGHHIGLRTRTTWHGHIAVVVMVGVVAASVLIALVIAVVAVALVAVVVVSLVVVLLVVVVVSLVVVLLIVVLVALVGAVILVILVVLLLRHVGLERLLILHGLIVLPWHEVRVLVRRPVEVLWLERLASHLIASRWLILGVWLHRCLSWGLCRWSWRERWSRTRRLELESWSS